MPCGRGVPLGELAGLRRLARRVFDLVEPYLGDRGGLRALLIRGASGTFALQIISMGLGFLTGLLLARLLGAAGYGAYAYALSWIAVLGVPAVLGLDTLLVRDVAAYRVRSSWGLTSGLLRRANQAVMLVSITLAGLAALVAWALSDRFDAGVLPTLLVALVLLPLVSLVRLRQAALRGLQQVVLGQVPETLVRPFLFLALTGGIFFYFGDGFVPAWAMVLNVVVTGVAFVVGTLLLRRAIPQTVVKASPVYQNRTWVRSVLPLMVLRGLQAVNGQAAPVLLGTIGGVEGVGIYAVASRGADLISFVAFAANVALSPVIASLYAAGDMRRLQRVVTKSVRVVLFCSLSAALVLVLFRGFFLGLFGEEFTRGGTALITLVVGLLVYAATAPAGALLVMTGYERDATLAVGTGALLNVILNVVFIPRYRLEGAASATAISMTLLSIIMVVLVYRRLGIHATALGRIRSDDAREQ